MTDSMRRFWRYLIHTRRQTVRWEEERCSGCLTCYEVCPVGCCLPDPERNKILPPDQARCVVCEACALQCPEGALTMQP